MGRKFFENTFKPDILAGKGPPRFPDNVRERMKTPRYRDSKKKSARTYFFGLGLWLNWQRFLHLRPSLPLRSSKFFS